MSTTVSNCQDGFWVKEAATFFFETKFETNHVEVLGIFFFQKRNEAQVIFSFQSSNGFMVQRLKNARF